MKKILAVITILTILFAVPVMAEEKAKITVTVNVTLPSLVEITGETNLPNETIVEVSSSYDFFLYFDEEGIYKYQIKQIPIDDGIVYDETVYDIYVFAVKEGDELKATVTLNIDGEKEKEASISFENTKQRVGEKDVYIKKVNEEGEPLCDAKLVLFKRDKVVESWITNGSMHKLSLPEGLYLMREEVAPSGYLKVKDFDLKITKEGIEIEEVEGVSLEGNIITIKDPKAQESPKAPIERIIEVIRTGDTNNILIPAGITLSAGLLAVILALAKRNK